jgi:hypothetical protein
MEPLKEIRQTLADFEFHAPDGESPNIFARELLMQRLSKLRQEAGIPEGREAELMDMVRNSRYYDDEDPEIIHQVREGFRALYDVS